MIIFGEVGLSCVAYSSRQAKLDCVTMQRSFAPIANINFLLRARGKAHAE